MSRERVVRRYNKKGTAKRDYKVSNALDYIKIPEIVVPNLKTNLYRDWTGRWDSAYHRLDIDNTVWGIWLSKGESHETFGLTGFEKTKEFNEKADLIRNAGFFLDYQKISADIIRRLKLVENYQWVKAINYREIFMIWQDYGIPLQDILEAYSSVFMQIITDNIAIIQNVTDEIYESLGITVNEKIGRIEKLDARYFVNDMKDQPLNEPADLMGREELHNLLDTAIGFKNRVTILMFLRYSMFKLVFASQRRQQFIMDLADDSIIPSPAYSRYKDYKWRRREEYVEKMVKEKQKERSEKKESERKAAMAELREKRERGIA